MQAWAVDLRQAGSLDGCLALLDEQEKSQAARFRFERDAHRYIVAHAATRLILAPICGMAPDALEYARNQWGKPALAGKGMPVFNLSHSGDYALVGVAGEGEIGVDIEQWRAVDYADMAGLCFSAQENARFEALAETDKQAGFFRAWSRKEAYIKAKGLGLSLPLKDFTVEFAAVDSAALLASDHAPQDVSRYRLWNLAVADGYGAALAYAGEDQGAPLLREWQMPANLQ